MEENATAGQEDVRTNEQASAGEQWSFLPEGMAGLAEGHADPQAFWAEHGRIASMLKEQRALGADVKSLVTPEQWEAHYKALGRPDKADGYDFANCMPGDASPEVRDQVEQLFKDDAKEIGELCHKHGLSQKQAEGIMRDVAALSAKGLAAGAPAPVEQTMKELWGADAAANYRLARAGAQAAGLGDALDQSGLSGSPLVLALCKALGEATAEDRLPGGQGSPALPQGKEAYQEMLRLQATEGYRNQDPSVVKLVERLSARANIQRQ